MTDFLKISSKIVPGFFCTVFCYAFILIFHFSGLAVVPPHKGVRKVQFCEEFAIGVELLQKLYDFLAFSGRSWRGRRASLKIKANQRKAQQGIANHSIAKQIIA